MAQRWRASQLYRKETRLASLAAVTDRFANCWCGVSVQLRVSISRSCGTKTGATKVHRGTTMPIIDCLPSRKRIQVSKMSKSRRREKFVLRDLGDNIFVLNWPEGHQK